MSVNDTTLSEVSICEEEFFLCVYVHISTGCGLPVLWYGCLYLVMWPSECVCGECVGSVCEKCVWGVCVGSVCVGSVYVCVSVFV